MRKVNVILGPTSSGKTSLGIKLCKSLGGDIISFDSRQIYKKMDIGTGKVPIGDSVKVKKKGKYWEFDGVRVYGYDLVKPNEFFSSYDFALWALPVISGLLSEGRNVFLVGGTGFYLDLLTKKVVPAQVKPNLKLRGELEKLTLSQVQKKLTHLNSEKLLTIDKNNPVRIIRAIEIEMGKQHSPTQLPYLKDTKFNYIGLTAPRKILFERADLWLNKVWDKVVKETESLIKEGYENTKPLNGLIYKSVKDLLNKKVDEEEAKERALGDLHAYIRRQQTYFNKNTKIVWFDITSPNFTEKIKNHVQSN